MPSRQTVEALAAAITAGRHDAAIEEFYTEAASMQENGAAPRVGREGLVANERGVMARFVGIQSERLGPSLIEGDHVASRWRFTFTLATGAVMVLEEISWQRWEGEKVAEERFFYDPAQMAPRPGA
jgi:hypothetical protein